MKFSMVLIGHIFPITDPRKDGTVFMDVFDRGRFPNGEKNNYAMIYAAPPDGCRTNYTDEQTFLNAIETTAQNIATIVGNYNALAATDAALNPIAIIRLSLYSSKIFARPNLENAQSKSSWNGETAYRVRACMKSTRVSPAISAPRSLAFGYFVLAPTGRLHDGDEASCCPATRYAIALEMQVYIIHGAMQLAKQK